MTKTTLSNVGDLRDSTTAAATINANNTTVQTAFDNTLSRDGTAPNTMNAGLDMNSNQIFNLPAPSTVNSPARLIDVTSNPTISIPGQGTAGHVVPFLDGNNTWSGAQTVSGTVTYSGVQSFNDGKLLLKGATSGSTVVKSAATASGTVTIPAVSDTLVGKATVDTLTNKTFNSAGTGNVLQVSGVTVSSGQYPGDTTNGNATAGNVGEYMSASLALGSAISLTTATAANPTGLTLTLTAGDWDVSGFVGFVGGATTSVTQFVCSISQTNGTTLDTTIPFAYNIFSTAARVDGGGNNDLFTGPLRLTVANGATLQIWLVVRSTFTVSTMTAYGAIRARRVR